MESIRQTAALARTADSLVLWINRALESLWLLGVLLVPLVFFGREFGEWSSVIGSYEIPKIALLKILVGIMASLWLVERAIHGRYGGTPFLKAARTWVPMTLLGTLRGWLRDQPTRWISLAVVLYLTSVILSTALSASFSVSMWGDVPGQDSYGAYTIIAYIVLFGAIATHLRTPAQLWRLLGAVVLMGVLVSGYAVLQHYGHDFLDLMEPPGKLRSTSTFGGAVFAGAVMLLTVPISLVVAINATKGSMKSGRFWLKVAPWTAVLAIQLLGLVFTFSRGPWVGTALALAGILGLGAVFVGWRMAVRCALLLVLAGALTSAVLLASPALTPSGDVGRPVVPIAGTSAQQATQRLISAVNQVSSEGLAGRLKIWENSWRLMTHHPWFEFDRLNVSYLRPVIGYGPDMFRYTYLLVSPPGAQHLLPNEVDHAHNFLLHHGVELGFLGLLTSLGVFVAVFLVGGYQLLWARRGYSAVHNLLLIGFLSTFGGRLVEQMVGVARVSDLTIFWVLLGGFAALPWVRRAQLQNPAPVSYSHHQDRAPQPPSQPIPPGQPPTWQRHGLLLMAVALTVGIGILTWTQTLQYPRAAVLADTAGAQFRKEDYAGSLSSLDRAIDLTPNVSTYYSDRVEASWALRQSGLVLTEGECPAAGASLPTELCLVQETYLRNLQWVDRRPFYFLARLALADSALDLGTLREDPALINQATQLYRDVSGMVPHSWTLWNRLGEVYLQIGRPAEALGLLEKSLAITGNKPFSTVAWRLKVRAYHQLGQSQQSIADLGEAIKSNPEHGELYYLRGTTYYELGDNEAAIRDLSQAIQIFPRYSEALYARGVVYYELGQYQNSITDMDQVIRLDPRHVRAYNNRGLAYARLGRLSRAIRDFDEAIRLDPKFDLAYNNRGFVYRDLGQPEKAIEDLDQAIQLNPTFALAYYNRALAHAQLGQESEARRDGQRAVELGFAPGILGRELLEAPAQP